MSSKLVKEFPSKVQQPNEQVILSLVFTNTGKSQLQSSLPPSETCKILMNFAMQVIFESCEQKEPSRIVAPTL